MSNLYDKEELLEDELTQEAEKSAAEYETQEDIIEEYQEEISQDENKITKLQDALARSQADFDNFKKRTQRDKDDMIFFLKADIFKKILPRLDDLERIIKNTPEKMQDGAVYQGVVTLQKTLLKDLNKLGVDAFQCIGKIIDPELHEVMTQIPGEEGIIIDEFEKGYLISGRVLRVAKVVAGNGQ